MCECDSGPLFCKMPKPNKGKCVLNAKLKEKYPFLETTKSDSDIFCKKCKGSFSIASGGNADIGRHIESSKHIDALSAASSSQKIVDFFTPTFDFATAASKATWAFHTINGNHSLKSADCATKIFRTCFKMNKFTCSKTKYQAIVVNVFAPEVKRMVHEELSQRRYVSIYTDASNHGSTKKFPVLVRFFNPLAGVYVKILDISSESGESSIIINDLLKKTAEEYGLEKKIIAFCGDNAKVNFGGETRGGQNNVFYRLKQWLPHLIGIGCVAHIVNNALKRACDVMPFDVECVIVKIYSYFYIYTTRVTALQEFCETAGVEYFKLLGYAKTRFLALGPAIKRVLQLYEPLKMLFIGLPKGEKLLKHFFSNSMSKFWLHFVLEQVQFSLFSCSQFK